MTVYKTVINSFGPAKS